MICSDSASIATRKVIDWACADKIEVMRDPVFKAARTRAREEDVDSFVWIEMSGGELRGAQCVGF